MMRNPVNKCARAPSGKVFRALRVTVIAGSCACAALLTLAGYEPQEREDLQAKEGPSHVASRRNPAALRHSASQQPQPFPVSPSALLRADDHRSTIPGTPHQGACDRSGSSPVRGAGELTFIGFKRGLNSVTNSVANAGRNGVTGGERPATNDDRFGGFARLGDG
jgi:hypothetical protein